jgi:KaiC/GvpD/RAD55 family RecA-like ATPase
VPLSVRQGGQGPAGPDSIGPISELLDNRAPHGAACDHLVQVYRNAGDLAESVAVFLAAGFELGEPAVLVATVAHRPLIEQRLDRHGWSAARLEADGMLTAADAEETLAALQERGEPSRRLFARVIGALLDRATAHETDRRVRVFGEMVDLLCRDGHAAAADTLEGLWNRLSARRNFILLCGYKIDVFDRNAQTTLLPQVCRSHSQVLPLVDPARMDEAVDAALVETLGAADTQKVYAQIARQERDVQVPASQLALMWVSAHMPRSAERILATARAQYLGTA